MDKFINVLADQNAQDKDFALLVDICEQEVGRFGQREDNYITRVLRIHNMIHELHMHGTIIDSSYRGN